MRISRSFRIGAVALCLSVAGCTTTTGSTTSATSWATTLSSASSTTGWPSTTIGSSTPETSTPKRHHVAPTPASDALEAKLIPAIGGYAIQPDDVGDTGPSDLAKATDDDGEADARAVLQKDGFVVGYQRLFASADNNRIVILFVYRFATHQGAASYQSQWARLATQGSPDDGPTTSFPVKSVPGAVGLGGTADDGSTVRIVLFTKGNYVAEIDTEVRGASDGSTDAATIAKQQYDRL